MSDTETEKYTKRAEARMQLESAFAAYVAAALAYGDGDTKIGDALADIATDAGLTLDIIAL